LEHWLSPGLGVQTLLKLALGCPRKRGKFLYGNKVRKPGYETILERANIPQGVNLNISQRSNEELTTDIIFE